MSITKKLKRPSDVIGNAIHVMRIATGGIEETPEADDEKDKATRALGRKGGKARADKLTAEPARGDRPEGSQKAVVLT